MDKRKVWRRLLAWVLLLSACGGSSGRNEAVDRAVGEEAGRYTASSYTNTDTSDADLSGTWICLENIDIEYIREASSYRSLSYIGQRRSVLSIVDNGDNTITLVTTWVQKDLPVTSGVLSFDLGGVDFAGQVINNRMIEGELVSYDDDIVVRDSAVTLVKISDDYAFENSGYIGHFDLNFIDYQDNSYSGSLVDKQIHSFSQAHYEITEKNGEEIQAKSIDHIFFMSISELPLSLSEEGEVWLDPHYVDIYTASDPSTPDNVIYFTPAYSSNMRDYTRYKWVETEVVENSSSVLLGSANSTTSPSDNAYIDIHFEIRL